MTMSLINSAMSLKDDHRTFHYFLAMTAVYAGFIVPWTAAFSNSAFSITASQTVYVTDFLFGVDFLGVTKEKFDLWKSASLTETENTFPVTRTVLAVLFSAFNFLPFNAVVQLQDKGMWTFTGNLAMLQVISRLRFAMKSRTAMTDRSGSLHKFQHVFAKLLKTMVFMMLLLHFFCCTWIMVCKLHCVDYFAELDALSSNSSTVEDEDVIAIRDSHDNRELSQVPRLLSSSTSFNSRSSFHPVLPCKSTLKLGRAVICWSCGYAGRYLRTPLRV